MGDFYNGFEDDFEGDEPFEDDIEEDFDESEEEDSIDDEPEMDNEPDEADSHEDDFNAKDAFILGGAMGWAYEEGLEEGRRRKLEKKVDNVHKIRKRKDL